MRWQGISTKEQRAKANAKLRAFLAANPEKAAKYRLRRRQKYRELQEQVLAIYGDRCACCLESYKKFLTLDHVHNDGNVERKKLGLWAYSLLLKIVMDASCRSSYQLLCWNCNMSKSKNNGKCPHTEIIVPYGWCVSG